MQQQLSGHPVQWWLLAFPSTLRLALALQFEMKNRRNRYSNKSWAALAGCPRQVVAVATRECSKGSKSGMVLFHSLSFLPNQVASHAAMTFADNTHPHPPPHTMCYALG